jgi:hypothetical protein
MKPLFLILFLSVFTFTLQAQQEAEREKIRQMEQQKEIDKSRKIRMQMDSGIYYMEREQYALADEKLKYALANMKAIPSDLVFFFGKNSFYIGKFKQSVDWLTKYIQLKGTSGQYSSEASEWLKQAEQELVKERQAESIKATEVFSRDYVIDCGPSGKVTCPVCSGSTVIVRKDYMGETYKTCGYCNHLGYLSCEDYNLLLRGQLKPAGTKDKP